MNVHCKVYICVYIEYCIYVCITPPPTHTRKPSQKAAACLCFLLTFFLCYFSPSSFPHAGTRPIITLHCQDVIGYYET